MVRTGARSIVGVEPWVWSWETSVCRTNGSPGVARWRVGMVGEEEMKGDGSRSRYMLRPCSYLPYWRGASVRRRSLEVVVITLIGVRTPRLMARLKGVAKLRVVNARFAVHTHGSSLMDPRDMTSNCDTLQPIQWEFLVWP